MRPALRSIEERRGVLMFTQVSHGDFLSGLFEEARSRFGIEFADQYPNLAVYTPQAKGLWGHEVVGGMAVRFFRWLDHDKPEIVVEGPYSNDETPEEFLDRFTREFWEAVEKLR
jgi:hypothetical protein